MTHGEIRGTLILLAIMAAIILGCYIARSCDSPSSIAAPAQTPSATAGQTTPASATSTSTTTITAEQLDSLHMEQTAAYYAAKDSLRKAERAANRAKHPRQSRSKSARKAPASHRPLPSPLDRPL
jgi:hypothetical protein